jgi:hypothetical protein
LAALYDTAFRSMLAEPAVALDLHDVDAVFLQLRVLQRRRWPQGSALVDAVGLQACDVIAACERTDRPRAESAFEAHARAVERLRGLLGALAARRQDA